MFDAVCLKLELVEKDYFGLTYEEKKVAKVWLFRVTLSLCKLEF